MILTQLETPLDTLETLCEITAAKGVPLILDPALAQPIGTNILKAVEWITPNEAETQLLTGRPLSKDPLSDSDLEASLQAESLLDMGARNVLLKLERAVRIWLGPRCARAFLLLPYTQSIPPEQATLSTRRLPLACSAAWNRRLLDGLPPQPPQFQ